MNFRPRLHEFGHFSVTDPGEALGGPVPPYFFETPPPPPPYLKVWIHHCFETASLFHSVSCGRCLKPPWRAVTQRCGFGERIWCRRKVDSRNKQWIKIKIYIYIINKFRRHCTTERVLNFEFFLPAGVESSQILQRRHSRTVSVGAANPRPFTDSKNTLVPNNLHPNNKIEQPHTMSVPNGTVMSERPSSPQKPKRPVSCRSALNLWNL